MGEEKKRKKKREKAEKDSGGPVQRPRCIIGRCSHCARRWLWLCVGRCGPYTRYAASLAGKKPSEGVFKFSHTKTIFECEKFAPQ